MAAAPVRGGESASGDRVQETGWGWGCRLGPLHSSLETVEGRRSSQRLASGVLWPGAAPPLSLSSSSHCVLSVGLVRTLQWVPPQRPHLDLITSAKT